MRAGAKQLAAAAAAACLRGLARWQLFKGDRLAAASAAFERVAKPAPKPLPAPGQDHSA